MAHSLVINLVICSWCFLCFDGFPFGLKSVCIFLEIAKTLFLLEALIAFIPGADIIDLIRSINSNDKLGVAFALGGLIAFTVGGSKIKGALKVLKFLTKLPE